MVTQGSIIKINFDPQVGCEAAGYRPAVVISNEIFNQKSRLSVVCPITNTVNNFPLHIPLDDRTKTTGVIMCEHVKSLDLRNRTYHVVEQLPDDILRQVISVVSAEIAWGYGVER